MDATLPDPAATPAQRALIADVRAMLGARAVTTDPGEIAPWTTDWRGRWHGRAAALLSPADTNEVAAIVRLAAHHRVALVPQGGNTSMVGGATPPSDGSALIVSLRRMDRIRQISGEAGLAVAEAGVILATLHDAAGGVGRRFPLTLGARGSATIGGLVSTNAGGTQVLRHGTMRQLVAGVEAVLPDGQVHDGLAALRKDNRGYDLNQLLIGAEGTLGIVTAATLRLVPAIGARAVAWAGLASPAAALQLLRRIERAGEAVESFEIIPGDSLDRVLAHLPGARAPGRCASTRSSESPGMISKLSTASPARSIRRSSCSAAAGDASPAQATARAPIAGTRRSVAAVTMPKVPSAPISNWLRS